MKGMGSGVEEGRNPGTGMGVQRGGETKAQRHRSPETDWGWGREGGLRESEGERPGVRVRERWRQRHREIAQRKRDTEIERKK